MSADRDPIANARARFKQYAATAWRYRSKEDGGDIEKLQDERAEISAENEQATNDFLKGINRGRNG